MRQCTSLHYHLSSINASPVTDSDLVFAIHKTKRVLRGEGSQKPLSNLPTTPVNSQFARTTHQLSLSQEQLLYCFLLTRLCFVRRYVFATTARRPTASGAYHHSPSLLESSRTRAIRMPAQSHAQYDLPPSTTPSAEHDKMV